MEKLYADHLNLTLIALLHRFVYSLPVCTTNLHFLFLRCLSLSISGNGDSEAEFLIISKVYSFFLLYLKIKSCYPPTELLIIMLINYYYYINRKKLTKLILKPSQSTQESFHCLIGQPVCGSHNPVTEIYFKSQRSSNSWIHLLLIAHSFLICIFPKTHVENQQMFFVQRYSVLKHSSPLLSKI